MSLNEALKDKTARPRPISLQEYRKRAESSSGHNGTVAVDTTPGRKNIRGGKTARLNAEIKEIHRILHITINKEQRCIFEAKLAALKKEKRKEGKKKAANKKVNDKNIQETFRKIFKS